jgi:hypothetical protein
MSGIVRFQPGAQVVCQPNVVVLAYLTLEDVDIFHRAMMARLRCQCNFAEAAFAMLLRG